MPPVKRLASIADRLPIYIITSGILTRLPVRFVSRCRSVCKAWLSAIDDPQFSIMHFNTYTLTESVSPSSFIWFDNGLTANRGFKTNIYIVEDKQLQNIRSPDTDSLELEKYIVGSSNGLICFYQVDLNSTNKQLVDYSMYWCNPSTWEVLRLPDISVRLSDISHEVMGLTSYGFGFDPFVKKFMVVLIYYKEIYCNSTRHEQGVGTVYTLRGSSSWKKKTYPQAKVPIENYRKSDVFIPNGEGKGLFVNGLLHWLEFNDHVPYYNILSFDMGRERFAAVPEQYLSSLCKESCLTLGVLGGCLCIFHNYLHDEYPYDKLYYDIWVMKEYNVSQSWTKLFIIDSRIMIERIHCKTILPICYGPNGELVLFCDYKFFVSYNHECGTATPFAEHFKADGRGFQQLPYVRSLISPISAWRNNL